MQKSILPLQTHFDLIKNTPISRVIFIHDYYELWMQKDYLRFYSELFVIKDGQSHTLPSKEANYIFSCLVDDKLSSIEEKENCIVIETLSGITITVDTLFEADGENFDMRHEGEISFSA
jgi:hypothetical protein